MGNTFADRHGREWSLEIDVGLLPALKEAGFNAVLTAKDAAGFDPLADPEVLGRVLWVLVGEQAGAGGVTPEQFARGLTGPALSAAMDALGGALADFSQRPAVAAAMKKRLPGATQKAEAEVVSRIEAWDPTRSATGSGSAGNSPGSAGSTPGP